MLRAPLGLLLAGNCAFERLDFAEARRLLEAALIQHRRMGHVHDAAASLRTLGEIAMNERRFDEARTHCAESLRIFRALQDRNCGAYSAEAHAAVLFAQGDSAGALREAEAAAATFRELGVVRHHALASVLGLIASIHSALGDRDAARQALRNGLSAQQQANRDRVLPRLLEAVAAMEPNARSAPVLLGSAAVLRKRWHLPVFPAERAEYERTYAAVREKRRGADFNRAVSAGRKLTRDEAIDMALGLMVTTGDA